MVRLLAVLLCIGVAQTAAAADQRWVTFKTGHNGFGLVQHQIDRQTIHQEGPAYWTFWTRMWRVENKEPVVASYYGMLIFWSQKFAVDCAGHRFGPDFIDSNLPSDRKHKAAPANMRWQSLAKFPAVEKTICVR